MLGLEITGLAALAAVIRAVGAQANVIQSLAQNTVFLAVAASFFAVALGTDEFRRHTKNVARSRPEGNGGAEEFFLKE